MSSIQDVIRRILVDADLLTGTDFAIGERIFRDEAPENTAFPYLTIDPEIASGVALTGDAKVTARGRTVQVNAWQDRASEQDLLRDQIETALDGARLDDTDQKVWGCRVLGSSRDLDPDDDVIHHIFDVLVTHAPPS